MIAVSDALRALPAGLRDPLLAEYQSIVQNYFEHRWSPSELSGGKLCEIVYTLLEGYASGKYAPTPQKPTNFVDACRRLEVHTHVPRSFQILLPRLLPALYEIRNNRGVGHVGGDVDPNHMDATAVLSLAHWIMAELVRVFHALSVAEAQQLVDALVERRMPLVWDVGTVKRVLLPNMALQDQVLVLLATTASPVSLDTLVSWTDSADLDYVKRLLRRLHRSRLLEFTEATETAQLLPPGTARVESIVKTAGTETKPSKTPARARRRGGRRR
jgi:hypothetical protein